MKKRTQKIKNLTYRFIKANGLSAVTALIVIILFIWVTKDTTKLFDLSFFTSLLFAIILEGIAHMLGSIMMNWLEDSAKLTTDYEQLIKQYPNTNWYRFKENQFPIIFEGWLQGAEIKIDDKPNVEPYQLPDIIRENFDEIISAHDTSSTYNRYMIRVDDWSVKDEVFDLSTSRTTYYDSLATNRAIDYKWKNGMSVRTLFEYGPFIHTLKESKLSNHLGYNGFIESSDGYILFIKRSKAVSIGKGTYGTSVSASLKTEFALNDEKEFYVDGLRAAIINEIEKETEIKESALKSFEIKDNLLAAYREFVEGGKPQLMFHAQSTLTKDEITANFRKAKKRKANTIFEKAAVDGKLLKWIKTTDLYTAEISANMMKCNGKKYNMMPSASACIGMLVQHLNNINVTEQYICGKENNPLTCEDGLYMDKHIVAIIDGVTSKGTRLWDGKSSGCYAKDILLQYLQENDVSNLSAKEIFTQLDQVLANAVKATNEDIAIEDYPRATIIIYNALYNEVWNYGDCQCRIDDIVHTHKKEVDTINESLRAETLVDYVKKGYSTEQLLARDYGRISIQENLIQQFQYENKDVEYGYPVLNGQGINEKFIKTYKIKPGTNIVLASDGYPKVERTLEESEKELERLLKEDPLCIYEYKATKGLKPGNVSFDDRVYCRVEV